MLYTDIFLISEQYIKQNSALMQNVEKQFIEQHIIEAQNIDMYNFLGAPLYSALMLEWDRFRKLDQSLPTTKPEDEVEPRFYFLTMDFLRPMLLYFTLYYSMYDLFMKLTNKGINEQNSQNSINADVKLVEKQRKDYKNKGEVYATRMLEFLNENADDYPEFQSGLDECGAGTSSAYSNPWYLGKSM